MWGPFSPKGTSDETHNIPDAQSKLQHKSWPTQRRSSEFPGVDADWKHAEYDADEFGEQVRASLNIQIVKLFNKLNIFPPPGGHQRDISALLDF